MGRVDHDIIQGLHWTEVPLPPGTEHPHLYSCQDPCRYPHTGDPHVTQCLVYLEGSPANSRLHWAECTCPTVEIALTLQVPQGNLVPQFWLGLNMGSLGLLAGQYIVRLGSKEMHTNPF